MRIAKPERHRDRRSQEQAKAAAITHTSPESEKLSASHSISKSLSHLPTSGLMIVSIYLHRYQLPPQSHISFPTNNTKEKEKKKRLTPKVNIQNDHFKEEKER